MKKKILKIVGTLTWLILLTCLVNAQTPGTGVVTVTASGGSCLSFTPAQGNGPDNWEVVEGGSYIMTITGVTECTGTDITVFIQSSSVGNWCFNASGGNGIYTGSFTMPGQACFTMPIGYKCGADQDCNNADLFDANGQSDNHKVHLRTSTFDGSCSKTGTDEDCNTCVATIGISADGPTTICPGSCVTLTASGGTSYLWSTGETGSSIVVCEEGDYSVEGVDANNCSGNSDEISISFHDAPEVSVEALGNTTICPEGCVTLSASGATSYVWSPNGEETTTIEACGAGSYSVVGTDANGCTAASDPIEVFEFTPPNVEVDIDGDPTACSPACVTLTASGAESYVWSPNVEDTESIQACASGTYSVVGTDLNGCTSASAEVEVTIHTPPTVTVSASGPTTVCSPACVTLNASGATSYVWSPGGSTTSSIEACTTGTYSVVGTDLNGCTDASNSVSVTINPTPSCSLSAPANLPICGLGGNTLSATITGTTTQIIWSVSSSNNSWQITAGQGTSSITYKAGTSGTTGTFTLTVKNGTCTSTCTVTFGSSCVQYCGYTQGFYGGTGKNCQQKTALQVINAALTSGGNMLLGTTQNRLTILSTEGSCLNNKMPGSTGPDTIPVASKTCGNVTSAYLNGSKWKSTLLGQVIALTINVRQQPSLGTLALTNNYFTTYAVPTNVCSGGTAVPGTKQVYFISQNVLNCLGANNTVNGLLALGNLALGNELPAGCTATRSEINDACDAINKGFDKCRIFAGFTSTSGGVRVADPSLDVTFETVVPALDLQVMPNPLSESSVIYFIAPENTSAVVEMYSVNGARVATLFNETVKADEPYAVELNTIDLKPGIYFIRVIVGQQSAVQKVVVMTK